MGGGSAVDFDYSLPGRDAGSGVLRRKKSSPEREDAIARAEGERLKSAYTLARRMYETSREGVCSRYQPPKSLEGSDNELEGGRRPDRWREWSLRLRAKGIDPEDYVRQVFLSLPGTLRSCPRPNQLLNESWLRIYRSSRLDIRRRIEEAFVLQREIARDAVLLEIACGERETKEAIAMVVTEPGLSLSALFRYCLAEKSGLPRVAGMYLHGAVLQYVPSRGEYDDVWGGHIPEEFRAKAARIYERMIRQLV